MVAIGRVGGVWGGRLLVLHDRTSVLCMCMCVLWVANINKFQRVYTSSFISLGRENMYDL